MGKNDTPAAALPGPEAVEAIIRGRHGDPFAVLGLHVQGKGAPLINVFAPDAAEVHVLDDKTGKDLGALDRLSAEGFFSGRIAGRRGRFAYRLRLRAGDQQWERRDAYAYPPVLGEIDEYLMAEGRHEELYHRLGAHPAQVEGVPGDRKSVV